MTPASLHVVGLGPGDAACLTPQARTVLSQATCVAGYNLYMELVPPELLAGKQCISTDGKFGIPSRRPHPRPGLLAVRRP